ncbi:hypothetical protein [Saccharopolyspora sp. NPDC050642]
MRHHRQQRSVRSDRTTIGWDRGGTTRLLLRAAWLELYAMLLR